MVAGRFLYLLGHTTEMSIKQQVQDSGVGEQDFLAFLGLFPLEG